MRLPLILTGAFVVSTVGFAQAPNGFAPGSYSMLPRTAAYDPQFDAWQIQVAADSFRVIDPTGALFLVSISKMSGDTLIWTDVIGPCTGVVSRYKVGRDSVGWKLDLIDDQCTDRAAAVPNMYFTPAKPSGGYSVLDRPRRYETSGSATTLHAH
jgi:hypothetical protein